MLNKKKKTRMFANKGKKTY